MQKCLDLPFPALGLEVLDQILIGLEEQLAAPGGAVIVDRDAIDQRAEKIFRFRVAPQPPEAVSLPVQGQDGRQGEPLGNVQASVDLQGRIVILEGDEQGGGPKADATLPVVPLLQQEVV